MSKICNACNKEVEENLNVCPYCGGTVSEETDAERIRRIAAAAEEEERRIIAQRKAQRAAAEKKKKIIIAIAAAAMLILAVIIVINTVIIPGNVYKQAEALREDGKYLEAMELYYSKPDHKGCKERIDEFESMLWDTLSGITWEDPEHIYERNLNSKYDCALYFNLQFDPVTRMCGRSKTFVYYKTGTKSRDWGKGDTYEHASQMHFMVEDGKVYTYGVADLGMIQLNGTVEEGRADIETLTCTVEMYEGNYQTTFLPY